MIARVVGKRTDETEGLGTDVGKEGKGLGKGGREMTGGGEGLL